MKPHFKENKGAIDFIYCTESEQIHLMFDTVHCGLLSYIKQCASCVLDQDTEQSNVLSLLTVQSCCDVIGMA